MAEKTTKKHTAIVNLDAFEMPENSNYIAVQCFGEIHETTRVERCILKMYNVKTMRPETFKKYERIAHTRFTWEERREFEKCVAVIEAYVRVWVQHMTIADLARTYISAFNRERAFSAKIPQEQAEEYRKKTEPLHMKELKLNWGILTALCRPVVEIFQEYGVPVYLMPPPFRMELKVLWDYADTFSWRTKQEEDFWKYVKEYPFPWQTPFGVGTTFEKQHKELVKSYIKY